MAATDRTLRLLASLRVQLARTVDAVTGETAAAWATAWNELAPEWDAAIAELITAGNAGKWPTRRQVQRAARVARAVQVTRDALDELSQAAGVTVTRALPDVLELTDTIHRQLIASQYPPAAGTEAALAATFGRVDPEAAAAIIKRSTQQITALHRPLSAEATQAMKSTLIRGVLLGDNPRTAAALMVRRVQGDFDGGLVRANVIARTEMLDAHRAAGLASDAANADVLAGWQWVAQLDKRTCPSCWAQHGGVHPLSEEGPLDHQQGRCARSPMTKSWRDLGFNIDEPASLIPDGRATFDALPQADRLAIMGPKRLQLLDSGHVAWGGLSQRRVTPGWRDSYHPRPVSALT